MDNNFNNQQYSQGQYNGTYYQPPVQPQMPGQPAPQFNNNGPELRDVDGKPMSNNYILKIILGALEFLAGLAFGITVFLFSMGSASIFAVLILFVICALGAVALIFAALQNGPYVKGDVPGFKLRSRISTAFLWADLAVILIIVFMIIISAAMGANRILGAIFGYRNDFYNNYNYDYDYDYDDDYDFDYGDDFDYDYDDDYSYDDDYDYGDIEYSESGYQYGNGTVEFYDYESIYVNGYPLSVPDTGANFLLAMPVDSDWESDPYTTTVYANSSEFLYTGGSTYGSTLLDFYNTTNIDAPMSTSYVGGIKLDLTGDKKISFNWRGITENDNIDDVYAKLGIPDDLYEGSYGIEMTYYCGNGWLSIEFDPTGSTMTEFWIQNDGVL